MIDRLAVIGVGLIGSSLALALKQAGEVGRVVGYGRDRKSLEKAMKLGVIDQIGNSVGDTCATADVILVSVPLGAMEQVFTELEKTLSGDAIVTDVGSAKGSVVDMARRTLGDGFARFVPGHPIAGAEKSGVEAGFAGLYQGHRVILTPLAETQQQAITTVSQMWQACGARVETLSVEHHDKVLAATSHLPHMLAYTLVHYLSGLNEHDEIFRYAAGGFRDFTRIASSDPVMWRDVCLSNGEALLRLIAEYQRELDQVSAAIRGRDADRLLKLFMRAKSERDTFAGNT